VGDLVMLKQDARFGEDLQPAIVRLGDKEVWDEISE